MTGNSIFGASDPMALVRDWMSEAAPKEPNDPGAMVLATVDAQGMPNARTVLLKGIEAQGLVFYTNYDSVKGHEIAATGQAAVVLHWKSIRRQVRARGPVERVEPELSDSYYASRPVDSRLGAWASRQSQPLADRETLMAEIEAARARFGDAPPRPPHWGGYRLKPLQMEFWADGPFRLHDREGWTRPDLETVWSIQRLFP
ncbi:MAG: pyridoxamine 5'-phosphate oxidase [Tranquillimonas sp.]|jgi:pyridoxamine 5'-phosphate oxidase